MKYCLGIDIGGTKTAVCISDFDGNIIEKCQFATDSQAGPEDLVKRISKHFEFLCEKTDIKKNNVFFAGVASPGPLDLKTGRIVHIATMGFCDVPISLMLENALKMPVFLQNDANCAALAEFKSGCAKGAESVVYVTISTGVGCGIVLNGQILSGHYSSAGEVGHLTVVPDGKDCPCGKKGCLELYSSGTAIAKNISELKGYSIDAKMAFDMAREGDTEAIAVIEDASDKLALGLSHIIQIIDPEVIVLGGSVTKDYSVFSKSLNVSLKKYTQFVGKRKHSIKISEFGGDQVIIGAVLYGANSFLNK